MGLSGFVWVAPRRNPPDSYPALLLERDLYRQVLGVDPPWRVTHIDFDKRPLHHESRNPLKHWEDEVTITVEYPGDGSPRCPERGQAVLSVVLPPNPALAGRTLALRVQVPDAAGGLHTQSTLQVVATGP